MRHDLRDLEASFCGNCHGWGCIPDGDDDHVRYERCDVCGGTGAMAGVEMPAGAYDPKAYSSRQRVVVLTFDTPEAAQAWDAAGQPLAELAVA